MVITEHPDAEFTRLALKYFGLKRVRLIVTDGKEDYPDIWCSPEKGKIWANQEWAKQKPTERRKRIVHELLHFVGMKHDYFIGYNTYPGLDIYSRKVYNNIIRNRKKIQAGTYGWKEGKIKCQN